MVVRSREVDRVRDVLRIMRPTFVSEPSLIMVLTAYLDDSGTHKESPYVAIAGAIGREAAWAALTLKWDALLTAADVDVFHCTDCMAQQGEFAGWAPEKSVVFVNKLIEVFLGSEGLYGIGACLCRRDYEALVAPERRKQVGYPTLLCLRHAIHRVDEFHEVDKSAQIGVIFESADDYAARGRDLFYTLRGEERWKHRLISFTDHPKQQFIPLQVADLIAWQLVKQLNSNLTYEAGPEGFKALDRSQMCKFTIFDDTGLRYHLRKLGMEPASGSATVGA